MEKGQIEDKPRYKIDTSVLIDTKIDTQIVAKVDLWLQENECHS